jgi:predicted dinucleotide-utilizing enzyme
MFRIGIVGAGAIGKEIARAIDNGTVPAKLEAIYDRDLAEATSFAASLKSKPKVLPLEELVEASNFVVEAASQAAVREVAIAALSKSRSVMIMSVGALADKELLETIRTMAKEHVCSVYLPSGAIGGLDAVKAASICRIESVTITTRKPRDGLRGAPFIVRNKIDVDSIDALVIAGGKGSPQYLWSNPDLLEKVREAYAKGKIVGAICISGVVLAQAGILKGKHATVFPDPVALAEYKKHEVVYEDVGVAVDGNVVTASGPDYARPFAEAILDMLRARLPVAP